MLARSKVVLVVNKQNTPPKSTLHPWSWPHQLWMRVHVDYAAPLLGKVFLVLMDAHSKWIEVEPVESAMTTQKLQWKS